MGHGSHFICFSISILQPTRSKFFIMNFTNGAACVCVRACVCAHNIARESEGGRANKCKTAAAHAKIFHYRYLKSHARSKRTQQHGTEMGIGAIQEESYRKEYKIDGLVEKGDDGELTETLLHTT